VFSPRQIIEALPELKLLEFSLIENNSAISWRQDAATTDADGLPYACGLFRFSR
jgi:hypothetical protein